MDKIKIVLIVFLLLFVMTPSVYAVSNSNESNSQTQTHDYNADFMVYDYVSCGDGLIQNIPYIVPRISSQLYNVIMVLVPAILVIMGAIDLIKGISSQKEDDIKKGRQSLAKRMFAGFATLLIVLLVKALISLLAGGSSNKIIGCVDCFINSGDSCTNMESGPVIVDHSSNSNSNSNSDSNSN